MSKLLQVNDLKIEFQTDHGAVVAVDGIDFSLEKGETLGLVGESGAGKSVTSLAVMGLLPKYASVTGSVNYQDKNLLAFTENQLQRIRGDRISMIFQEPMTSLNPVFTIQEQLSETIELHQGGSRAEIL